VRKCVCQFVYECVCVKSGTYGQEVTSAEKSSYNNRQLWDSKPDVDVLGHCCNKQYQTFRWRNGYSITSSIFGLWRWCTDGILKRLQVSLIHKTVYS